MSSGISVLIGYTEIKHPFAFLVNSGSGATCVFFESERKHIIISWNDLPMNYPRWVFSTHTKENALIRITEMVKEEGWELIETSEDELKPLERMT